MTPQEREVLVLGYLDGRLDDRELGRLDESLCRDPALARLLAELSFNEALLIEGFESTPTAVRRVPPAPARSFQRVVAVAAAAAGFLALLLWAAGREESIPAVRPVVEHRTEAPKPVPVAPAPKPEVEETPKERPVPAPRPEPPPSSVPPVPASRAPKVEPAPAPAPKAPDPEPPKTVEPPSTRIVKDAPAPRRISLSSLRGSLSLVRGGRPASVDERGEIRGDDVLSTGPRRGGFFAVDNDVQCWLDRSTSIGLDRDEQGALRIRLAAGTLFLKSAETATISTPMGDIKAQGASLEAELEKGRLQVLVQENSAVARNPKGEQMIRAGQRSTMRAGEKPSPPAKAEVEAATAWARSPILAVEPPEGPFLEREPGANRRLSGLVVAAPFSDGEELSGRMARAVAESGDAALVLGHGYRDPKRSIWINVDRGMEGDVAADGTVSNERFTERARRSTAEYLDQCRAAGGVTGRDPAPAILQFRTHYLKQGGAGVDVAELAWSGWGKAVLAQAKGYYAQLLDKHKPGVRLELKVQGLDETYDWRGSRRKFSLADDDAREEGYLAPRNARNALTIFLPDGFARGPGELDAYARIFAELAEFLNARRR
jgi:ferric-dicitrate binding protein FerR (iron transport regulator)